MQYSSSDSVAKKQMSSYQQQSAGSFRPVVLEIRNRPLFIAPLYIVPLLALALYSISFDVTLNVRNGETQTVLKKTLFLQLEQELLQQFNKSNLAVTKVKNISAVPRNEPVLVNLNDFTGQDQKIKEEQLLVVEERNASVTFKRTNANLGDKPVILQLEQEQQVNKSNTAGTTMRNMTPVPINEHILGNASDFITQDKLKNKEQLLALKELLLELKQRNASTIFESKSASLGNKESAVDSMNSFLDDATNKKTEHLTDVRAQINTTAPASTCAPLCYEAWNTAAKGNTCGARINYLISFHRKSEYDACYKVAVQEFSLECGKCAPTTGSKNEAQLQDSTRAPSKAIHTSLNSETSSIDAKSQSHRITTIGYTSPLKEYIPVTDGTFSISQPRPLQILEQYKRWHSRETVLNELNSTAINQRKYLIAYINCPHSAGNRLHEFTNSFVWAVLTNRTLLLKYWDRQECYDMIARFQSFSLEAEHCEKAGTAVSCNNILVAAPWMLTHEEALETIPLLKNVPHQPMKRGQTSAGGVQRLEEFGAKLTSVFPSPHRLMKPREHFPEQCHMQFGNAWHQKLCQDIFVHGSPFLFGLLLRTAIDFAPLLKQQQQSIVEQYGSYRHISEASGATASSNSSLPSADAVSIALHSRHISPHDTGCNVVKEQQCLANILRTLSTRTSTHWNEQPCQVTVLTDRTCTAEHLQQWLHNFTHCNVVQALHETEMDGAGVFKEHGPFSGAGFFQDLYVASKTVTDAVIGGKHPSAQWRSSSSLVEEIVSYARYMRAWSQGRRTNQRELQVFDVVKCTLPK